MNSYLIILILAISGLSLLFSIAYIFLNSFFSKLKRRSLLYIFIVNILIIGVYLYNTAGFDIRIDLFLVCIAIINHLLSLLIVLTLYKNNKHNRHRKLSKRRQ